MNYDHHAARFQLLSHPVRLQILDELRRQEACVCHLQAVTGRPQAYVSQLLSSLRSAGMVEDEKDGQNVYYFLRDPNLRRLLDDVLGEPGPPVMPDGCCCPQCSTQAELNYQSAVDSTVRKE